MLSKCRVRPGRGEINKEEKNKNGKKERKTYKLFKGHYRSRKKWKRYSLSWLSIHSAQSHFDGRLGCGGWDARESCHSTQRTDRASAEGGRRQKIHKISLISAGPHFKSAYYLMSWHWAVMCLAVSGSCDVTVITLVSGARPSIPLITLADVSAAHEIAEW